MSNKNWFFLLLSSIFIYLLIFQIVAIWPFTIDDMFISLRYAKHWASGEGLLWNIDQPPVEGYSNFLFVAIAALAIKLTLDPIFVLKSMGLIGLMLTTYSLYLLTRFWFIPILALLPSLGLLVYRDEILWAVSGLETTVYQFLLCFSVFSLLKATGYQFYPQTRKEIRTSYFILSGFLLSLASLTRPEGPFFMLLFFSIAWFDKPKIKNNNDYYRGLALGFFTFLITYGPYFLWRLFYYEQLFPNPIYCKGYSKASIALLDKNYLKLSWPFLLLAIPAIWQARDKRHYYFWLPSIVYLVLLFSADPLVAFYNRLFLPAFALLLPLSLQGILILIRIYVGSENSSKFINYSVGVIALWVGSVFLPVTNLFDLNHFTKNPQNGEHLRKRVAEWLNKNISPDNYVSLADCGLIPYFSSHHFIDSYCLNNREMTKISGQEMYQQQCLNTFRQKPKVIILTALLSRKNVIYAPVDACLNEPLKTNKEYQFKTSFQVGNPNEGYRYEVYTALN